MPATSISAKSSVESLRSCSSLLSAPDKLPPAVAGPMAWEGSELDPAKYIIELSSTEIENIKAAIISFKLQGLDRGEISQATFPLSSGLAHKLSLVSNELHQGQGVVVLRGLHAANFNDEEAVIAFVGVCSYVCPLRATDSYANQTLSHVRDATHDKVPKWADGIGLAGSKITSAMDFHSDRFSGDILALHVRNGGEAGEGGQQKIASFHKIYNELLEKEPAVLETMAEAQWPFELKQKDRDPYLELGPTLFFSKGRPICQLVKAPLLGSPRIQRDPRMPKLSAEQMRALDAVEEQANRFCTTIDRQTGDIQFLNNLSIMHARAAYGTNGKQSKRHLQRLFLLDPENAWEKPARYSNNFADPFTPGRRQDIPIVDTDPWRRISGRESHG